MMFRFSCGHPDKECRQQGEDICLKEGHQQLYAVHEKHKEDGYRGDEHRLENKYQRHQTQDDDMTCGDICKETYHECKRLGKEADDLNRYHYREKPDGNTGSSKDMPPVRPIGTELRDQEGKNCQYERHVDVTGHIGAKREEKGSAPTGC